MNLIVCVLFFCTWFIYLIKLHKRQFHILNVSYNFTLVLSLHDTPPLALLYPCCAQLKIPLYFENNFELKLELEPQIISDFYYMFTSSLIIILKHLHEIYRQRKQANFSSPKKKATCKGLALNELWGMISNTLNPFISRTTKTHGHPALLAQLVVFLERFFICDVIFCLVPMSVNSLLSHSICLTFSLSFSRYVYQSVSLPST